MIIEFDKQAWQQRAHEPRRICERVRPDWRGLQMRLLAARDARRAFAAERSEVRSESCGSFDEPAARWLGVLEPRSAFVNLTDSANRNAGGFNVGFVADELTSGDRG